MAYARALVAGYKPDNIDDLISFADAFGASRLRYKRPLSKWNDFRQLGVRTVFLEIKLK